MISIRKAQPNPQVISTNRHILQGWVELKDVKWNEKKKTLSGTAKVIGGEPFKIVIANNSASPKMAKAKGSKCKLAPHSVTGLSNLTLSTDNSTDVKWEIIYQ